MKTVWVALLLATALLVTGPDPLAADSNDFQATAKETDSAWKDKNIETINTVRTIISDWANSWQEKNIDRYMSYYGRNFRSGSLDYEVWRDRKAQIFNRPGAISMQVSDLGVVIEGNHAIASFVQHYQDARHKDVGEKIIQLVQIDGIWQIISEEWRPLSR
jgi:murein L,D-transpeptidase YafK